jgi:hypothetical protein
MAIPALSMSVAQQNKLKGVQEEHAQAIIVLMSSGRLILDRVARQQSPSPLHRSQSE